MIEKILMTATEYFFYNQVSRKSFFLKKKFEKILRHENKVLILS